jgi:hypothetical protein
MTNAHYELDGINFTYDFLSNIFNHKTYSRDFKSDKSKLKKVSLLRDIENRFNLYSFVLDNCKPCNDELSDLEFGALYKLYDEGIDGKSITNFTLSVEMLISIWLNEINPTDPEQTFSKRSVTSYDKAIFIKLLEIIEIASYFQGEDE